VQWEAGTWEIYMVHDSLWAAAGMEPLGGHLCIACLEARLGRQLCWNDFPPHGNLPTDLDTPRLRSRMRRDPTAGGAS